MEKLIENFAEQMKTALEIGEAYGFKASPKQFSNVVICGLGGSGIGGSLIKDATINEIKIPVNTVNGYFLPAFVGENSLIIISSYSGNTEEALHCLEEALKKNATICAITSNGKVKELSQEHGFDCIFIPGGNPPRSTLGMSATQLLYILNYFELISDTFKNDLRKTISLISSDRDDIKKVANELAQGIYNKIPVLYSSDHIESVTIRWRQQINENGKQLCWHHVLPEMNHNELVGWRDKNDDLAVVFLRNDNDFPKVAKRMDLNKEVYKTCTPHIYEIWSKGESFLERAIYLIHLGDWLTLYLSHLRGYDTTEVNVIDQLKANLAE